MAVLKQIGVLHFGCLVEGLPDYGCGCAGLGNLLPHSIPAAAGARYNLYLTESVYEAVVQKSIPAQIREINSLSSL